MACFPARRKWLLFLLVACAVSTAFISHELYFNRGYWAKSPELFAELPHTNSSSSTPSTDTDATTTPAPTPGQKNLIVSAMFPLSKSKHPLSDYKDWLHNFFQITTPIYIFLPQSLASLLPADLPPHMTVNASYSSPFELPVMKDLEVVYEENWALDREKERHGPELYSIWNAKPWMLQEGAKNMGGDWERIFWVDAGSFREEHWYREWPAPERVREVWGVDVDKVEGGKGDEVFFPIFELPKEKNRKWKEGDGPIDEDVSNASFFGGSPAAIRWYNSVFYAYHDYYLSKNYFIGKDQSIVNALFLLFPSRFIGVFYDDPHSPAYISPSSIVDHRWWRNTWKSLFAAFTTTRALGKCGSEWYYYQFFFAKEEERSKMQDIWLVQHDDWDKWPFGNGDKVDEGMRCRLTTSLAMDEVLVRPDVFGVNWTPPERTLSMAE